MSMGTGRSKPLVVMVHGTRDEGASFEPVATALPELQVAHYDRRGWGADPDWNGVPATVEEHVDDFFAFLGGRRASVIGHSWGGNIALRAAIRRPELIASVGVYETALPWAPWWPAGHRDLILGAAERIRAPRPGTPRQVRERALFVAEAVAGVDAPFEVERLRVPCVAGYGTGSDERFIAGVRAFVELTSAELVTLPNATHMAHRDDVDGFTKFVRRVVAASGTRPD